MRAASVTVSSPSVPPARMKKTVSSSSKSSTCSGSPSAPDKHLAIVPHRITLAVGRHCNEVDVGVGVGRAGGVGSVQEARHDAVVGPAGIGEPLQEGIQRL